MGQKQAKQGGADDMMTRMVKNDQVSTGEYSTGRFLVACYATL